MTIPSRPGPIVFDRNPSYRALETVLSRSDSRQIAETMRRTRLARDRGQFVATTVMAFLIVITWVWITAGTVRYFQFATADSSGFGLVLAISIGALVYLALTALVVNYLRITLRRRTSPADTYRISTFARDNDFSFTATDRRPYRTGAIFGLGFWGTSYNKLASKRNPRMDIFNYECFVAGGTRRWGVMALQLARPLPHMVLQARKNKSPGGKAMPMQFAPKQILSLEGDFDRHFTLYCPQQFERDALYVFTPDLMALLIDEASAFDLEIVDDTMFVYAPRPFRLTEPPTFERLFRIARIVGARAVRRSAVYADDRVNPASSLSGSRAQDYVVSPGGRRLRLRWMGSALGAIVGVALAGVIVHFAQVH